MSSILTNNSAMVALQTLKSINSNLSKTQDEISTGKSVATAKDNAAIWSISKVMEADVKGFKAISESLSLGESTVAVARNASETVTDLLTEIKGKIVASQEENVDRAKIQTDIDALKEQIGSVISAAQFNGKNLVNSYDQSSILSSLDRDSSGTVTANSISFTGQNLTSASGTLETASALDRIGTIDDAGTYTVGNGASLTNTANTTDLVLANDLADSATLNISFGDQQFSYTNTTGSAIAVADLSNIVAAGLSNLGVEGVTTTSDGVDTVTIASTNKFEAIAIQGSSSGATTVDVNGAGAGVEETLVARAETVSLGGAGNTGGVVNEGDGFQIALGGQAFNYVAKDGDTLNDVATGLKRVLDAGGLEGIEVKVNISDDPTIDPPTIQIDNDGATAVALTVDDGADGVASGGLVGLDGIDVTTQEGAENALANIESLIETSIDAAAQFGSVQSRIETQSDFIGKLTDALKSGIGSLVDADMEEASARLQALQVQQQLGTQSLSIANQAPQNILALFR
ncbi:flagellin [Dinoroseobacter sp. PD6]|uniref:flagellin n=1 Tax=Dinoroseobacter sp. PD6 TaxID=3028384 RepID=UPI00237C08B1|nr:flagellin [Dinoroseobacter sp. PD6]MDD9718185.1 flagellin [Dinoroseobacter sp. PD6]